MASGRRKSGVWRLLRGLGAIVILFVGSLVGRTLLLTSAGQSVAAIAPVVLDADVLAERLAGALRIKTVSTPAGDAPGERERFDEMRAYLARHYPLVHAQLSPELVNSCSLMFEWKGRRADLKPVLLMSHFDVVPGEVPFQLKQWTYPPFDGRIADGFIWGRGAWDDKLGVLGILEATEALLKEKHQPQRTIWFHFGCDEEVSGQRGAVKAAALLAQRGIKFAWALDEGLTIAEGIIPGVKAAGLIGIAEKGFLNVELDSALEGGHSSMPGRQTAIGILAGAIDRIEKNPMPASMPFASREMLRKLGPEMPFAQRLIMANLWLFQPLVEAQMKVAPATAAGIRTTMAPTIINAGVKDNVLPPSAQAVVNVRIRPGDSIADVLAHMTRVVNDPRVNIKAKAAANEPTRDASLEAEGYRAVERSIRQVFPDAAVAPALMVAATDSRHFLGLVEDVYRFDPVRAVSSDLPRFHGVDERISIKGYADAVRFYRQILLNASEELKPK